MAEETTDTTPTGESVAATADGSGDDSQYSTLNPKPEDGETGDVEGQTGDKGDTKTEGEPEPAGAPEQYEDFTVPEGMELDTAALENFAPIAKELNLSQDQAQKLVDMYASQVQGLQKAQIEAMAAQRAEWVNQIRTDQEIGGVDMNKKIGVAVKAIDHFAGREFRQLLHDTGLSDHPDMVRAFYKIGMAMEEDKMTPGHAGGSAQKTPAQIMYPDMPSKGV